MEQLLSGDKLSTELDFVKRHADTISTLKIKYPSSHVPPVEQRARKATLANIPVVEPPAVSSEEGPSTSETVNLIIKSTKPPLSFTLAAPPTSSIATLKAQLRAQESSAPPVEAQRWILKGKAMGDQKLLKEFAVEDGATINLMVSKTTTPAAPTAEVPSLVLSEAEPGSSKPTLNISTSIPSPTTEGSVDKFAESVSSPQLWTDALTILKRHFGDDESSAEKVWEAWLSGSIQWISPSAKAAIREKVGLSAMGGTA